jgi:hypothetical protein
MRMLDTLQIKRTPTTNFDCKPCRPGHVLLMAFAKIVVPIVLFLTGLHCDSGKTVAINDGNAPILRPPSREDTYKLFSVNEVRTESDALFSSRSPFEGAEIKQARLLQPRSDMPRLIVVYLIDALRADQLEIFGCDRDTSPNMVKFAETAVVFEHCYSYATWTLPSVRSLFSSMHVPTNVVASQAGGIPEDAELLQDVLQREGWLTAFISESPFIATQNGLAGGFDLQAPIYRQINHVSGPQHGPRTNVFSMKAVMSRLTSLTEFAFLERHGNQPTFLYIHTLETHEPYAAPEPLDQLKPIGGSMSNMKAVKYDMATRFADHNFGLFIAMLKDRGLFDETLLIVTADHGETLVKGECEDSMGHGGYLCLAKNHVPLIVSWPKKIAGGRRVSENVQLLDIAPTILDLAGISVPQSYAGNSLRPLLLGEDATHFKNRIIMLSGSNGGRPEEDRALVNLSDAGHASGGSNLGLVHDDSFFIRFNTHNSLYRPSLGDSLQPNIAADNMDEVARLAESLARQLAENAIYVAPDASESAGQTTQEDDEAHRAALKALGYVN